MISVSRLRPRWWSSTRSVRAEVDTTEDFCDVPDVSTYPGSSSVHLDNLLRNNHVRVYASFIKRIGTTGLSGLAGNKLAQLVDMSYVPDFQLDKHISNVQGLIEAPQPIRLAYDANATTFVAENSISFLMHSTTDCSAAVVYEVNGGLIFWCPAKANMSPGYTLTLEWPKTGLFKLS